jgi:hypothetical protein
MADEIFASVETSEPQAPPVEAEPISDFIERRNQEEFEAKHPTQPEESAENEQQQPRPRNGYEKRIAKLTRRNHEAERKIADLEARFANVSQTRPAPQDSTESPAPRSTRERYRPHDYDGTISAAQKTPISSRLAAEIAKAPNPQDIVYHLQKNPGLLYALEREPNKTAERIRQIAGEFDSIHNSFERESERESQRQDQLRLAHRRRIDVAMSAVPDRAKVQSAMDSTMVAPSVAAAILEQDNSDQLALHLARNPEIARQLNSLSPAAAAAKIGRLAESLDAKAERPQPPKPPAPIKPVGGSSVNSSVPLDQLPMKEFMKIRNAQERSRR